MSQHDYDISTADANTGVTMRSAINAAFQALAGNNSGATEPATKYPYMWWADTTSGYLKQRNAANSAWIAVMLLATALMSNSDACDGFHASQTPAANQIPVLNSSGRLVLDGTDDGLSKIQTGGSIKAGGLRLSGSSFISWGDGQSRISNSSAGVLTEYANTFIHYRELSIGPYYWFTTNMTTGGQIGLLWWGKLNPANNSTFIGTHATVPATRFYANSANDFFWAYAPNNGIDGELTFTNRMSFQADTGRLLLGPTLPTDNGIDALQVNGTIASTGYKLSALNTAPASVSAAGTLGEIRITADAIYICTATNTWKKVAIATW